MTIRLFDYWRSSASYRVRIALALKGVDYERVDVSLVDGAQRAAEHLARNPQGFVPTLEVDGQIITQSLAIIDYLDARFPEPPMVSHDPVARARTLSQALTIVSDIHPLNNLRVLKKLAAEFRAEEPQRDDWVRHWVREGFAALEAMVKDAGPFLGGEAPNLADVCLVPQMYNARRFNLNLGAFPTLVRIDAAAHAHPAFAAAHPDRFKPQ